MSTILLTLGGLGFITIIDFIVGGDSSDVTIPHAILTGILLMCSFLMRIYNLLADNISRLKISK